MSNLYQILQNIEKRPSMYLGKAAISNLRSYLSGYLIAKRELGISSTEQEQEFNQFTDWVKQKFHINSDQSWDKIILFYSEDEKIALERFFELFNEFLKSKHQISKSSSTVS